MTSRQRRSPDTVYDTPLPDFAGMSDWDLWNTCRTYDFIARHPQGRSDGLLAWVRLCRPRLQAAALQRSLDLDSPLAADDLSHHSRSSPEVV